MNKEIKKQDGNFTAVFLWFTFVLWMFASWLTHVIVCIQESEWGFLIAGAIFAPVGMIHGTGIWFGAW
jgi:hypothetical protein